MFWNRLKVSPRAEPGIEVEHGLQESMRKMLQVRLVRKPQHLNLRKMKIKLSLLCGCAVSGGDTAISLVL